MTLDSRKAEFKRVLSDSIEEFSRNPAPIGAGGVAGVHVATPLEHVTRKHILDSMLTGLGWQLTGLGTVVAEEARLKVEDDETLYIDYLGFNPESQLPLLIFEAKAYGKPVPSSRVGRNRRPPSSPDTEYRDIVRLILDGIDHCKAGLTVETSPLVREWAEWVEQVFGYVAGIANQSNHNVQRAAISDGNWLVVFTNPAVTFMGASRGSEEAVLYFRPGSLVESSNDIYGWLAREFIVHDVPPALRPTQLPAYVTADKVVAVFKAVWLMRPINASAPFDAFPRIYLQAALAIVRDDGICPGCREQRRRGTAREEAIGNLGASLRKVG